MSKKLFPPPSPPLPPLPPLPPPRRVATLVRDVHCPWQSTETLGPGPASDHLFSRAPRARV
eukprot:4599592-Pyramimonas_sp.AAC.1